MSTIQWPELISALVKSGMTQPQLAEAASCGQSTISDLLKGRTTDPRTSTGLALIRLANARCGLALRLDDEAPRACACGAWEMAPEGEGGRVSSPAPPPDASEHSLAPAAAMLLGGRREDDHPDSGFGVLVENGESLSEQIDAVGRLVGDVPVRQLGQGDAA